MLTSEKLIKSFVLEYRAIIVSVFQCVVSVTDLRTDFVSGVQSSDFKDLEFTMVHILSEKCFGF